MKPVHTSDMASKFTLGETLQIWPWRQSCSHTTAGRHGEREEHIIKDKSILIGSCSSSNLLAEGHFSAQARDTPGCPQGFISWHRNTLVPCLSHVLSASSTEMFQVVSNSVQH